MREEGLSALLDRLGGADALRFLQQFNPGRGNYTRDRHKWLRDLTVGGIVREMEADEVEKSR